MCCFVNGFSFVLLPQPSIANATNIDTLIAGTEGHEEVSIPPESVQDKVFFIFNNLSLANMDQKVPYFLSLDMRQPGIVPVCRVVN